MNYLSLNFLTQLKYYESPTFCLLFAGLEEKEEWDGDWGGEEDGIFNIVVQYNCNHGYKK